MKQISLTFLYVFTAIHCFSQAIRYADYHCVDDQEALTKQVIANKQAISDGMSFPRETIYVPVTFHMVADDDGAGRVDVEDVFDQLCALNEEFLDTGFEFYIDEDFNFINNTLVYEAPTGGAAVAEMIRQKRDNGANALNIFITLNARMGNEENGTVLGFYAFENDWIVIRRNQIGNGENTLAHEIGHYFSLKHPHSGWESDPWEENRHGNPVLQNRINGVQIELVDGSNCNTAGDQLCDTPPDYNFGLRWDLSCPPFNLNVEDRNGDTIVPQQNNYMSYFIGCQPYIFTPDQRNLMMADYNSGRKDAIRTGFTPPTAEIENTLELISPENNTTTAFYNGVELSWTPVANATSYYIEIRSGAEEIIRFTTGTTIYITELSPNKTYIWSVRPFSNLKTCASKETNILKTNDVTTATADPSFVESMTVFPNPLTSNQNLQIDIESGSSVDGVLHLYSMSGKLVHRQQQAIKSGANHIRIDLNHIKSGLYMLSLATIDGNIERKIIITNH